LESRAFNTRITVLEQIGYREWTEGLGSDREWLIQRVQAELYLALQDVATKHGAFSMPARYDYMLILSSNVGYEALVEMLDVARSYSKVGVRMASSCDLNPVDAEARAFKLLAKTEIGGLTYTSCPGEEVVAIAHLDLNNTTGATAYEGVTRSYHRILSLLGRLATVAESGGGVAQYLGGDNILVILPPLNYISLAERLVKEGDLKAGIGVSKTAREALRLAARALHDLRLARDRRIIAYANI
jgi:GTP cyclohydrolase IIa